MDKQWFKNEVNKINVPTKEIRESIDKGIKRAKREKTFRPKRAVKRTVFVSSAAAVLLLGSGFVSPAMQSVLADVPLIGKAYQQFHDYVGQNLVAGQLVTELNEKASSNNIDVTATSVYFDGGIIGMTFKVKSDTRKDLDDGARMIHFTLFNGERKWAIASQGDLKKTEDGYTGYIQVGYPDKHIPDKLTLPVTITNINGIRGKWKFDIPVDKLPYKTLHITKNNTQSADGHKLAVKTVILGKESTVIDYEVSNSEEHPNDRTSIIKVTDDKGNEIPYLSGGQRTTDSTKKGNKVRHEERLILEKVNKGTKYLKIEASSSMGDSEKTLPLTKTPAALSADRHDFQIAVDQVKQNGSKLSVDYHLKHVDQSKIDMDSMQNFLETMSLVDSDYKGFDEAPEGHSVKGNFTKVLDPEKLRFRSDFTLDGEFGAKNFSLDQYSLDVEFGYLSAFYSTPFKPIKVQLPQ